jgi:hypothetical protein
VLSIAGKQKKPLNPGRSAHLNISQFVAQGITKEKRCVIITVGHQRPAMCKAN